MRIHLLSAICLLSTVLCQPASAAVALAWRDNSSNEDGFALERRQPPAAFAEIGRVAANVRTFNDATATGEGRTFEYRVRAYRGTPNVFSPYSNTASITFPTVPPDGTPDGLTATETTIVAQANGDITATVTLVTPTGQKTATVTGKIQVARRPAWRLWEHLIKPRDARESGAVAEVTAVEARAL